MYKHLIAITAIVTMYSIPSMSSAQTISDFYPEQPKLLASDGATADQFGSSVAISGSTAIVGAFRDDDNGTSSGSAYIYQFDGNAWQETKITPGWAEAFEYFGYSVAISDSTAIVGAPFDFGNEITSGVAYIYQFDGNAWQETKITASDGA